MMDAEFLMSGTSYGAWWAVAEAADQALGWRNVQNDPGLRALVTILMRTAAALSEGENYLDPRAAL